VTDSSPATTNSAPRPSPWQWIVWLWRWLRRPWLAITAGVIGVLLALAAWQLPQLPGQLVDEQAAASTWLLNTSTGYGLWGNAFLALGLFHVLRSPLIYLLLALLVPTLATQLADQLGALRQQHALHNAMVKEVTDAPGTAIALPTTRHLFRWRGIVPSSITNAAASLEAQLRATFTNVTRSEAALEKILPESINESSLDEADPDHSPLHEIRMLGTRRERMNYVRPLLMIGLLISVTGAWISLAFGWQTTAPPLAPGATFRSANRSLLLHYAVPSTGTGDTGAANPTLEAVLQGSRIELVVDQAVRQPLGAATLRARPAFPGIWIATADGSEQLMLPGDNNLRGYVGMVFATPGSEESVLLPDQAAGLRIVQRSGSDGFILELYRSDADQPVYRAELTPGGQLTVPLAPDELELLVSSLPGLQVDVRRLPGLWLVPLGILLALIGAVAYTRASAFALVQVAPWQAQHGVVNIQSDDPAILARLRSHVETIAGEPEQEDVTPGDVGNVSAAEPERS
jgi:hypothetical protein